MANAGKLEWPPRENWMSSKVGDWRTGHKQLEPDDTQFLRADTCTPNEECVSKAELEVFIRELEGMANPDRSDDGMDLAWGAVTNSSLMKRDARATAYGIVAKRLREVMDK